MNPVFKNKVILLTGGTGSFGRAFTKILLENYDFQALRIYSRDELKQHQMASVHDDPRLRFFIGDVRDADRLERAMRGVDIVIHAAAMKQVPACEYNPFEAVKTNIIGSQNIVNAAINNGVKRVLAISTDKAVNPVNLYGATKLCAEKIFVQGNSYAGETGTRFSCVRYGNVVSSRGSVIPLFLEQKDSGVVTITDKRMSRFWITLPQAIALVIKSLGLMHGGEIFIPRIPSMRIMSLAEAVAPECRIKVVGIRPGEKLREILITEEESRHTIAYNGFYIIEPEFQWWGTRNGRKGTPVEEGFIYASDTNDWWLSTGELKRIIHTDQIVEERRRGKKAGAKQREVLSPVCASVD